MMSSWYVCILTNAGFSYEYKMCQEEGANLENAYGPGLTGLVNLGSSCYINSVVQMLVSVPDFVKSYADASTTLFQSMDPLQGQEDFNWQMAKLIRYITSGDYSEVGLTLTTVFGRQKFSLPRFRRGPTSTASSRGSSDEWLVEVTLNSPPYSSRTLRSTSGE